MVFRITSPEVLNNLVRFKDNLSELRDRKQREEEEEHEDGKKRKYKVLLNRKTGDMRFVQKISFLEERVAKRRSKKGPPEDFKEIQIIVHDQKNQSPKFEVSDVEENSLNSHELDPLAYRVANETVDLLNKKAKKEADLPKKFLPEEELLRDLSSIQIEKESDQIQNLPGWIGSISRINAEKLLKSKEVGTYLLREGDEITVQSTFHLNEVNQLSIRPYLLTVVESDEKISDLLLLQTDKGWTLYHDDPNIRDSEIYHFFHSAKELIGQLQDIAKNPLKKES